MASTTWSPDLRRPVYAMRVLCEVANERSVATSEILAGTGIGPGDLNDPEAVVAASDEIVAVRRVLAALPDHAGLGPMVEYADRRGLANACRLIFNMNEFVFMD